MTGLHIMRKLSLISLVMCLLCAVCVCAMGAAIKCASCGDKNGSGSKFCDQCGSPLASVRGQGKAAADVPAVVVQQEPAAVLSATVSATVVACELKAASEALQKRNGWLALFYCENAMALNSLADCPKDVEGKLLEMHGQCMAAVKSGAKPCRMCDGTGSFVLRSSSMSKESRDRNKAAVQETCTACNGVGVVAGRAGLDALRSSYDGTLKAYGLQREAAKWSPIGSTWVPAGIAGNLSWRQVSTLKRVTASRCPDCAGFGQVSCIKCDGVSRLKCTSKSCTNGFVPRKSGDRMMMVRCGVCDGRAAIRCSACEGSGGKACKTCRGRGKLPVCRKCDGDGLRRCDGCGGTGFVKKVLCIACRGCGQILCRSCLGAARVKETD